MGASLPPYPLGKRCAARTKKRRTKKRTKQIDNCSSQRLVRPFLFRLLARWTELRNLKVSSPVGGARAGPPTPPRARQGGSLRDRDQVRQPRKSKKDLKVKNQQTNTYQQTKKRHKTRPNPTLIVNSQKAKQKIKICMKNIELSKLRKNEKH